MILFRKKSVRINPLRELVYLSFVLFYFCYVDYDGNPTVGRLVSYCKRPIRVLTFVKSIKDIKKLIFLKDLIHDKVE